MTSTNPHKNRLIIVDDDFDLRDSLFDFFTHSDFDVLTFASGKEMLAQLDDQFDGVIVCDLQMPGMTGLEVVEALSEQDNPPPLVLMTAYGDVPTAVSAIQLGAYDFIEKPFDPAQLKEKVERASKPRSYGKQARNLRQNVEQYEKEMIRQALIDKEGHIANVCDHLNIPRRTLNEKLLKYNLNRLDFVRK